MMIKKFISGVVLAASMFTYASAASEGTITIPVSEYEKLREAVEAKKDAQYWNMTFQQILDKKNGNVSDAWKLYNYYVKRVVTLDSQVTSGSVSRLIDEMNVLNEIDNFKPIYMYVRSPGGSVYDGITLLNRMSNIEAPVYTVCDGMAASMAAVIVAAGDYRIANRSCHWMIHEVGAGSPGGQTIDHVKWAEFIVDIEDLLYDIISKRSGLSHEEVAVLGELETFYSSNEILRLGVVDEVRNGKEFSVDARDIPEDLLPRNRMKFNLSRKLSK